MISAMTIRVITSFDSTDTLSIVEVSPFSHARQEGIAGRGKARCKPGDSFSPRVGKGIATGRAFADFGRQLAELWEARSRTQEEMAGYDIIAPTHAE